VIAKKAFVLVNRWYLLIRQKSGLCCGACVDNCQNGVFEKERMPSKAIDPDGCRGYQNCCPTGSIAYFGDAGQFKARRLFFLVGQCSL